MSKPTLRFKDKYPQMVDCECGGNLHCPQCKGNEWFVPLNNIYPNPPKNIVICYDCHGLKEQFATGKCSNCNGNGWHPAKCGYCGLKLTEEDLKAPYQDEDDHGGGNPICDECHTDHYYFTCSRCEEYGHISEAFQDGNKVDPPVPWNWEHTVICIRCKGS